MIAVRGIKGNTRCFKRKIPLISQGEIITTSKKKKKDQIAFYFTQRFMLLQNP